MNLFDKRRAAPRLEPAAADLSLAPTGEPEPPRAEEVEGERGIPSINRARSVQSRMNSILAIGLMSAIGVGLLTWYYSGVIARGAQTEQSAKAAAKTRAQTEMPLPPLGPIQPPPVVATDAPQAVDRLLGPPPELPDPAALAAWEQADALSRTSQAPAPSQKTAGELAFERRLTGEVFSRESSERGAARADDPAPLGPLGVATSADAFDSSTMASAANTGDDLGALLQPRLTPAEYARVLPTRRFLLPKGAFIDCTLETAIDSTLPGMTTCITATDTFGADGKVVLLERGSKLVGETRGQVQHGSARLFVLWSEARTATGVVVPLASPGTDELGRAGLPGEVNRHFWDRFGAAILISVINGAIQTAVQSSNESGGTVIVNPSASQDVMTEVLKGTIAIRPTVTKHQGDRIQVLVARDLDFRSVYALQLAATRPALEPSP